MVPGQRLPSRQKTATSSPTVADAEGDDVLAARAPVRLYFFQQGRRRIIADLLFLPFFFRTHAHRVRIVENVHLNTFKYFSVHRPSRATFVLT